MVDITLCSGKGCPYADYCYRTKAKPDAYQSYFVEPPYKEVPKRKCKTKGKTYKYTVMGDGCDYYIEINLCSDECRESHGIEIVKRKSKRT